MRAHFARFAFLVLLPSAVLAAPDPAPEPEESSTVSASVTFTSYQRKSKSGVKHFNVPHGAFHTEAEACEAKLGVSVGPKFFECLVARLRTEGSLADAQSDEFTEYYRSADDSHELKKALRNFTCSMDDSGSEIIAKTTWKYDGAAACAAEAERGVTGGLKLYKGFLPAGNDHPTLISQHPMTVLEAQNKCKADATCKGFTFTQATGLQDGEPVETTQAVMYFKTNGANVGAGEGWFSYKIVKPAQCSADDKPVTYDVSVLNLNPYVAVVHDFATETECEHLYAVAEENGIRRSTVGGVGTTTTSIDRSSSSANMVPDLDDLQDPLTRLTMRAFSFVSDLGGLPVSPPGQEPLNAVIYSPGQQYNSHCDGDCSDRPYVNGKRTASTLVYCTVADKGGATSFTKAGLKVVPKKRDFLLFSHRNSETGDMSELTEHSGCPVREGDKWVATQWYREGVSEDARWNSFENWGM